MSADGDGPVRRPTKAIFEGERPARRRRSRHSGQTVPTPCGPVKRDVLKRLERSFDTHHLLEAIDTLDDIYRALRDSGLGDGGETRRELLKLQGMTQVVIDGWDSCLVPADSRPLWEIADELRFELSGWATRLDDLVEMLDEIAALAPDEDDTEP